MAKAKKAAAPAKKTASKKSVAPAKKAAPTKAAAPAKKTAPKKEVDKGGYFSGNVYVRFK